MKTLFFLFSPLLVILFVNCSNENHSTVVTQPKEVSTVLMQIKSSANGPFQSIADSAIIQISADDMLDFEKELNLDEGAITGVVEGIPAGINRKIIVKVFDSLGVVHYQGATISNLEANDTTKINLAIYRVGADLELKGTVNDSTLLNEGLVAYYTFEGDARDLSGNGHHGIVHGASLTQDRFGNADGAYAFGGNDSENWIEVPGQVLVNYPFSISFIVQSATYTEPGTASNGFVAILDSNRMDRHFAVFEQLSGGIRMSARNGLWYHEKSNLYLDDDDFHLIRSVCLRK